MKLENQMVSLGTFGHLSLGYTFYQTPKQWHPLAAFLPLGMPLLESLIIYKQAKQVSKVFIEMG